MANIFGALHFFRVISADFRREKHQQNMRNGGGIKRSGCTISSLLPAQKCI